MKRRNFLRNSSAVLAGAVLLNAHCSSPVPDTTAPRLIHPLAFDSLIGELMKTNDKRSGDLMKQQLRDPSHRWHGGVRNGYQIPNATTTAGTIRILIPSYTSAISKYYQSPEIAETLDLALDYLLRVQHEDGTVDLYSTNFHSTPDVGFLVKWLGPVYVLLEKMKQPEAQKLAAKLLEFIIRGGEALAVGGIHTPNHRWVVSAALAWVNRLSPNQKYVDRIDQWLSEGIDIDPDGQFNEKSAFTYSPICDLSFVFMGRLLKREALFDIVRRNLEMTLYYAHPNGEVVTEASGRQDKYRVGHFAAYYYPYRFMALKDGNPQFAAMCELIEKTALPGVYGQLPYMLEDEFLLQKLPETKPLPTNYEKAFPYSHLVRIRRENIDATILAKNASFFTFFKQDAVLQAVRLASAFFGAGQFEAEEVKKEGNSYLLTWELSKPYYQLLPKEELPDDGDWNKMPRDKRPLSEVQTLRKEIRITEKDGTFEIDIKIEGTDHVPVAVELAFRKGGTLKGVRPLEKVEEAYLLNESEGSYTFDNNIITFGSGKAEHEWVELRGALEKSDAMCVYLTGYTPFQHKLTIK